MSNQVVPSMNLEFWIWVLLNIVFFVLLYIVPKYQYRYLRRKGFRSRYNLSLVCLAIGGIQLVMCCLLGLFPGLILFYAYLSAFSIFAWFVSKVSGFDITQISDTVLVLSQAPFFALIGFLFGIFHEYYGTKE